MHRRPARCTRQRTDTQDKSQAITINPLATLAGATQQKIWNLKEDQIRWKAHQDSADFDAEPVQLEYKITEAILAQSLFSTLVQEIISIRRDSDALPEAHSTSCLLSSERHLTEDIITVSGA